MGFPKNIAQMGAPQFGDQMMAKLALIRDTPNWLAEVAPKIGFQKERPRCSATDWLSDREL